MATRREHIDHAIAQLQAQRALLGDEVVEVALAALRAQRATLDDAEPAQQLRQVSVLFLDVVGSTALSQHLDPEEIQGVMDAALAAFTSLVDRHGGRVMQYAGDSVLAAFGTEEAHEDDAERAVLCGLALLREARVQAARVQAQHGWAGFGIRVGISSGDVLLGGGVDGEGTIRGITVNMAARMEQTAPPGQLRISHETWSLVRGLFDVEAQPPLQVKGRDEPVMSYLVRAALPAPVLPLRRGVQGRRTPLHGRESERAALAAALADARPGAGPVLLSLLAEAGLGKTRLLDDFLAALEPGRVQVLRAAALERRRHRPFGMVRALLMAHFGLADTDGHPAEPGEWLACAGPALGDRANAAVLGHLVGLDFAAEPEVAALAADGRRLRERARHHAAQVLLMADARPLLLALDDLHWADEASLELLDELLAARPERAVTVLALARPELLQRRPDWGGAAAEHRALHLAPLAGTEGQALAASLLAPLAGAPGAEALAARLADSAEGNPFFLEELVNMLIDQGVIAVVPGVNGGMNGGMDGAQWQLRDDRLPALRLPPTLKGVLQARLSGLPAQARRALQLASVAGPVFWDLALAALDAQATQDIPTLHDGQFIEPQAQSRLDAAAQYAFRHHSVHRVAYDSVLRRVKRAAHAVLARWLQGRSDAASLQDQIAGHLEAAGERLPAAYAWQAASEAARQRFANADAREQARRALGLLGDDEPERQLELHLMLARCCDSLSDRDGMAQACQGLADTAAVLDSAAARSLALSWQARWQLSFGEGTRGLALAREAVEASAGLSARDRVRAEAELLHLLGRQGMNDELRARGEQVLLLAQQAGHAHQLAVIHNQLGMAASDQGELDRAIAHYEAALAGHRALARPDNEGGTLANLAFAHMALGEFDLARDQFVAAATLCDRVGQLQHLGIIEINLAIVAVNQGDAEQARGWASRALARLAATGDLWSEAAARRVLGQAAARQGRHDDAADELRAAREIFEQLQQPALAVEVRAAEADAALRRGDVAQAHAAAQAVMQALTAASGTAVLEGADEPLRVWHTTACALHIAGDPLAVQAIERGRAELMRRAQALGSESRRARFLGEVPLHRALRDGVLVLV